jgi:membrane-bound lytic murein transglycosylase D
MIRKTLLALFLSLITLYSVQAQGNIPDRIEYCGITLKLTPGAKTKLKAYVDAIYESPRFFNTMVEKADTYMPFIEEAFKDANLPEDLKYLVIQESSLKADAISDSDAVGYWQFKIDPAREFGLQVDEYIDERQHIFRASEAAAQYFHKANYDFDNWVYAVVAYYEGLTGAVRYTDPNYYSKREMVVTENLHWYAMKAIAHKLAYEVALKMERQPRVWLEPKSTGGEPEIAVLCQKNSIPAELFIEYNKWATNRMVLPEGTSLTYYIPHFSEPYPGHATDPLKPSVKENIASNQPIIPQESDSVSPAVSEISDELQLPTEIDQLPTESEQIPSETPDEELTSTETTPPTPKRTVRGEAKEITESPDVDYALFYAKADLDHGMDFILYEKGTSFGTIAQQYKVPLGKLASWNGVRGGQLPQEGTYLYLAKPDKGAFHIVAPGETINRIAVYRKTSIKSIYKKNRYAKNQRDIYVGQKLYLGSKKPKGEKIIILKAENPFEVKEEVISIPVANQSTPGMYTPENQGYQPETKIKKPIEEKVKPPVQKENPDTNQEPIQEETSDYNGPETRWVNHTVAPGETLWSISVTYGTKVEIIKLINKMPNNDLSEGMVLRILAKEDKLRELGIE